MKRNCNWCTKPYDSTRPTSKFCSTTCRVRNSRAVPSAPPVEVSSRKQKVRSAASSSKSAANSITPDVDPKPPGEHPFVTSTRQELEVAGVLDSVTGQQVLLLAVQMCGRETAGGMTSLSKEFSRMRAEVLRSVPSAVIDPVDEVRARREKKMAG